MSKTDSQQGQRPPDWEAIERDFRAGVLSLREIAALHPGTNHVAISRRAKREGWTRDLKERIHARAEELMAQAAVTPPPVTPGETARRVSADREVIEANAARIAQVRGEHRANIQRARNLALTLLAELEGQTDQLELLEQLGVLMAKPDDKGIDRLNELYHKVLATPGRIDSFKKLAEALRIVVAMEREAYGLNVDNGDRGIPTVRVKDYTGRTPAPEA